MIGARRPDEFGPPAVMVPLRLRPVLGPPPDWYKLKRRRSRSCPSRGRSWPNSAESFRSMVEVRVIDSTAMVRYLVLPKRPNARQTSGRTNWSPSSRDAMIGVIPVTMGNGRTT